MMYSSRISNHNTIRWNIKIHVSAGSNHYIISNYDFPYNGRITAKNDTVSKNWGTRIFSTSYPPQYIP